MRFQKQGMMKGRILILTIFLIGARQFTFCQKAIPTVGMPMPEFKLSDVDYYSKEQVSAEDFKGKWLFLDFWYRGCVSCIKSFPKTNLLQTRFNDKIQFVLVGVNSERSFGKGIKPLYEKLREKMQLHLPIAYDSVLEQRWRISSFPHIIIVNPQGIVHSITAGHDMTQEKIAALIEGKTVFFEPKDIEQPQFVAKSVKNEDSLLISRTVLTVWNGEKQTIPEVRYYSRESNKLVFKVAMAHLPWLYKMAYFGKTFWFSHDSLYSKVYPHLLFETENIKVFEFDFLKGTGLYNYELAIPIRSDPPRQIMQSLQEDLQISFGFIGTIETRKMPVWQLISKPGAAAKLKTKGGKPGETNDIQGDGGAGGFGFTNYPIGYLLNLVSRYISEGEPPFFDMTGITHNIDVTIDAALTDRAQIRKELQRYGLDLVKGEKEMKVLVIRDAKELKLSKIY